MASDGPATGIGPSVTADAMKSESPKISESYGHSPHTRKPEIAVSCVEHLTNALPNMPAISKNLILVLRLATAL